MALKYTQLQAGQTPTLGTSGDAVKALQTQYNTQNAGKAGYVPLKIDGQYGPLTQAASAFKSPATTDAPTNTSAQASVPNGKESASTDVKGTVSTEAPATETPESYTVSKGDTLNEIAKKNNTNVQALLSSNPDIKNPDKISAGGQIKLPGAPKGTQAKGTANQYQNDLHKTISTVTDQSKASDVRDAASNVPYPGSELSPAVNTSVNSLIDTLVPQLKKALDPATYQDTLVDEYKKFSKDSGLDELNTQYINLENVINGTEDDIRAELTKGGGTATESQVQALTASRNKSLILKANNLQALITQKQNTLDTMIGLEEKDRTMADTKVNTATDLVTKLATLQTTMDKNTNDNYDKIITNVGYQGLAEALQGDKYAQGLAEKSLGLPTGTLSNPEALKSLETYREQTLSQGAQRVQQGEQRIIIQSQNAGSMGTARDALTASRYASIVNSTMKSMYATNKAPLQAYNNSAQTIARVDAAKALLDDPKNKNKGAADLDLLDSYISIARGGQQLTEAQVDTLLKSKGVKAKWDTASQKFTGSATLDPATRDQLYKLSHSIFDHQKDLANQSVDKINQALIQRKVPSDFLLNSPDEIGDPSLFGGGAYSNGKHYDTGQTVKIGKTTLTANDDGTWTGPNGELYDDEGNSLDE